jgi:cell division protein FtsI (penicillin-binding protein 3)
LNGYSAGGKTGTAQKVDPATHTYSHTKLVASFAGFAPVSSPAISVAVVIDTPTVGSGYGADGVGAGLPGGGAAGAGVPWGAARPAAEDAQGAARRRLPETMPDDAPSENVGDLSAMFDEINNLPADDPLRAAQHRLRANSAPMLAAERRVRWLPRHRALAAARPRAFWAAAGEGGGCLQAKWRHKFGDAGRRGAAPNSARLTLRRRSSPAPMARWWWMPGSAWLCRRLRADALRRVVETAAALGLRVEPVGSGIAREQAPAAGTMVPLGTEVVVRFAR